MPGFHLYLHIPFCIKKCGYCDFLSFAGAQAYQEDYVRALQQEIAQGKAEFEGRKITSIFFGGGTPTVLPSLQLCRLLDGILEQYDVDDDCEITLEANPQTVTMKSLSDYHYAGVNRLSFGLQAWQDRLLKRLGRIHSQKTFVENYLQARQAGFSNISVDLMFDLPGQRLDDWKETLQEVALLRPEHISAYSLIIEEGTPFYEQQQAGLILPEDDALDREMYHMAIDILSQQGYGQYEISNFARPGFLCRHNLAYWDVEEYAGMGLGAHSYVDGIRYHNTADLASYLQAKGNPALVRVEKERLTEQEQMEEFLFLGLRKTAGISTDIFQTKFGASFTSLFGRPMEEMVQEGLLIQQDGQVFFTPRGMDLCDYVTNQLLFALEEKKEETPLSRSRKK
ncbi:MAG TPA: radical SAM family heme chaperone HemW [Firmicutes bacterium]|nr:radical SAM family heme chaperone HemW [Bacillota bacterium]